MVELRGGRELAWARDLLLGSRREELVALFGRSAKSEDGLLFLVQDAERAPEEHITRDRRGLHWSPGLTKLWSERVEERGQGIVLVHAHCGVEAALSATDEVTCERMLAHFPMLLPGQAHGYVVITEHTVAGHFSYEGRTAGLGQMRIVGCPVRKWSPHVSELPPAPSAMARQASAITDLGQARMAAATIALVGVGGGGSIVADQLAHMGVGHLLLCEEDHVEDVNLSRQTGAGPSNLGAAKTHVMAAAVRHANPAVRVTVIEERFPGPRSFLALRTADVIVSAVDGPTSRHEVNKFGLRYLVPVVDVGASIRRDDGDLVMIAGHTFRMLPGSACMECEGLTSEMLRQREVGGRGVPYFEGPEAAGGAPQIMSVNGVLASLAVTEVLRMVAGLTEDGSSRHLRYEALEGEVYSRGLSEERCVVCSVKGMGDGIGK